MKTEFQGKYFNGVVSKPFSCEVGLDRRTIVIRILNEETGQVSEILNWDIDAISKKDIEVGGKTRIKYGNYPFQVLEVTDKTFLSSFKFTYPQFSFAKKQLFHFLTKGWVVLLGFIFFLLLIGYLLFRVVLPNVAEYTATKVPKSVEKSIGDAAYESSAESFTEDSIKGALLQEFFEEMHLDREYEYTLTVLNSETVNAFALPGGRITVYSGILDSIQTPEALAALLAHESSHVELQHSMKSIFRSLSGYFVVSLIVGDLGTITSIVFQNINAFQGLQYSRIMEKEADIRGLEVMQKSGIDPEGIIQLFNTISSDEEEDSDSGTKNLSEFVSTHPLTKHRKEYIQEYLDKDTRKYSNNIKLDSLFLLIKAKPETTSIDQE